MKDKSFIGLFISLCTTTKGRKSWINLILLTTPLDLKKEKNKPNQKNVLPVKPVAVALALNHV